MTLVKDIIPFMEDQAPSRLTCDWDNTGLLIGSLSWKAEKILTVLDATQSAVVHAAKNGFNMIVSHHPVIFSPLKKIDFDSPTGRIIGLCYERRISVLAAHTNMDKAKGGLNDILAQKIGLINTKAFMPDYLPPAVKLVVYVPVEAEQDVLKAFSNTGKGTIGNYASCAYTSRGQGSFIPLENAKPYKGEPGKTETVNEVKMEFTLPEKDLDPVLHTLLKAHPYETPAYYVYPLKPEHIGEGLGRAGEFPQKTTLGELALSLKQLFGLKALRFAGNPDLTVQKAVLCTGSGSSLLKRFFQTDAHVYISGDMGHHDALDIGEYGKGMIDLGHYTTESFVAEAFTNQLKKCALKKGLSLHIESYKEEENPFHLV